ncbi:MAG: mechanosensitive ion channel family protein [Holosporales bacterium]|nr:mechanosensitive ion channel family protein [Holosporales bacterium]
MLLSLLSYGSTAELAVDRAPEAIIKSKIDNVSNLLSNNLIPCLTIIISVCALMFFWILSKLVIENRLNKRVKTGICAPHIIEEFFVACKDVLIAFLPNCALLVAILFIIHFSTYKIDSFILPIFRTYAILLLACSFVHRIFAPDHAFARLVAFNDKAAKTVSATTNAFLTLVAFGSLFQALIDQTYPWFDSIFGMAYVVFACLCISLKIFDCQDDVADWFNRIINAGNCDSTKSSRLLNTLYHINKHWGHISILVTLIGGASWFFHKNTSLANFIIKILIVLLMLFTMQYLLAFLIAKKNAIIAKSLSAKTTFDARLFSYSERLSLSFILFFCIVWAFFALHLCGVDMTAITANIHVYGIAGLAVNALIAAAIYLLYTGAELVLEYKTQENFRSELHSKTIFPLFKSVMRIVVFVLSALVILSNFGINIAPLIAGFGVFGLAVSFATQDIIKSFIQGLIILAEDNFLVGDLVKVNDFEGFVEKLTIRTIHLREKTGKLDVIPYNAIVTYCNMSRDFKLNLFELRLDIGADIDKLSSILNECNDFIIKDPGHNLKIIEPASILGVKSIEGRDVVLLWGIKTSPDPFGYIGLSMNKMLRAKLIENGISLPTEDRYVHFDRDNPPCLQITPSNKQ